MRRLFLLGVAWLACACGPEPRPTPPPTGPRSTVRIRVFTETSGARLLQPIGKYVFGAAGHGLDRWDLSNQTVLPMDAEAGLPGDRVVAMSADAGRGWVWIATDAGVGYYEVASGTFTQLALPPTTTGIDLANGSIHLAGAIDGGVWVGHDKGLLYANSSGGWVTTPITEPVHAVHVDGAGWLWIASDSGVIGRKPSGEVLEYGPQHGCAVEKPRLIVPAPGGGVLVIGEDGKGQQRFALWREESWSSFRVLPDVRWDVAVPQGGTIVAMGKGNAQLFRLSPRIAGAVRPLTRDGARVISLVAKETAPFVIDIVDAELPTEPLAITGAGDELLVSTRDLGIARYTARGGAPSGWLRRKQMFDGAESLSVACHDRDDCWLAMGAKRAWHWLGDHFEPGGPDLVVLAVIRDASGEIYALHRGTDQDTMQLSRISGKDWVEVPGVQLKPPGSQPSVSFARFAPNGQLWVGLLYKDEGVQELTPWGVALIDVAAGKVEYHRATGPDDPQPPKKGRHKDKDKKKPKVMPVPIGAVDAAFIDEHEVWFATSEGAARMVDGKIQLWSEKDQMPSELLHAVAATSGGLVFVASNAGIAAFDGETWSYPRNLAFPVADLAVTPDGKLWMATERGIAVYDGKKVRRLDVRRGLVDNELLDLALDQFGRVWARGKGSVVLVMP